MGARICPRCATRVDERQARTSPFCLRCGAPLGPPSPSDGGRSSTFAGKQPGAGGSPLPWILGGIGLVVLVGVGGIITLIAVAASSAAPDPRPATTISSQPRVETPGTATATVSAPTTPTVKAPAPAPTVRPPSFPTAASTAAPRPTFTVAPPVPTPPTSPTSPTTTSPTGTGTGTGGAVALAPFNRTKAQGEVDRVGATLASCKRAAGPFGAGTIRIDFEPDGRVGTLSRPPFSGTPVGSCISARFLGIRIGPFAGSVQSIEKAFIIQD